MADDFAGHSGAALVAGGTGGIGAAVVELLAARGSTVAFTYRARAERADAMVAKLGPATRALRLDLTDHDACAEVVGEVAASHGGLHTLVYAAGPHVPMVQLSRVTPAQFRAQMEQEAVGFFNLVSAALPHLREARGSLVAVTTAATRRYPVRDGLSAVPKGAVEALVRGIAAEEGRYGVRANCVGPGMLTDGMAQRLMANGDLDDAALAITRANIPLREFGTAVDVAEAACFLASPRARYITGQHLPVDGGYSI